MKLFTKIALGITGFFFSIAVICLVLAFAMGVTVTDVQTMIRDGKFRFGPEDIVHISLGDDEPETSLLFEHYEENYEENREENYMQSKDYSSHEITHVCTTLNVKLGAGKVEIYSDDVPNVQIQQKNIPGFAVTSSEADQMLCVEGDMDIVDCPDASLTIILPRNVRLETVYLEVGASEVNLYDIISEEFEFVAGAGQANLSNLEVGDCDIEVGAGQAVVKNLLVRDLDVETGVGEVDIEIAGAETEYCYDVECGIGKVIVGDRSFGGMGAGQEITNLNAVKEMNIECGVGEVCVRFTCNGTDGSCEDASHGHGHHRDHE